MFIRFTQVIRIYGTKCSTVQFNSPNNPVTGRILILKLLKPRTNLRKLKTRGNGTELETLEG